MQITDMNMLTCPGGGVLTHHHTAEHEIHYIIRGYGTFTNQGRKLPMDDHSLYYSAPHQVHTVENRHPDGDFIFFFVRFLPGRECVPLMKELAGIFNEQGVIRASHSTATLFERMRMDAMGGDEHMRTAAALRLRAFMHGICAGRSAGSDEHMNPHVVTAVRLLQQNLHEAFSLDGLARQVGLEKSYLIRLFKRETGTTPQRYRMKLRIDSAAYLLRHTDRAVNRIAAALGFYDEFYFSRTFKKMVGVPPSHYRG